MPGFKQISVSQADYDDYEAMLKTWATQHEGVMLSLAKLIRLAMTDYKAKMRNE